LVVWGRRFQSMKRRAAGWARPTVYNGATYLVCNTEYTVLVYNLIIFHNIIIT
jgi:hypothetical protein